MKLFSYDSDFMKYGSYLYELMLISLYTSVITIATLGVGFGAAFTAYVYAIDRTFFEEVGSAHSNFLKSLKTNYKQATKIWIFMLVFIVTSTILSSVQFKLLHYAIIIEFMVLSIYSFTLLAYIEFDTKELLTKSFLFMHKRFYHSLTLISTIFLLMWLSTKIGLIFLLILPVVGILASIVLLRGGLFIYFSDEQKAKLFRFTLDILEEEH